MIRCCFRFMVRIIRNANSPDSIISSSGMNAVMFFIILWCIIANMHELSFETMCRLLNAHVPSQSNILDIGATHGIWNYSKAVENHGSRYFCMDMAVGADYKPSDIYNWGEEVPFGWDCIISGQCLEHDKFFWITLKQIADRVKNGGFVIIIVPSCGPEHRYPVDCYRFYQDCGPVFAEIMGVEFIAHEWHQCTDWGDLAMVFRKP